MIADAPVLGNDFSPSSTTGHGIGRRQRGLGLAYVPYAVALLLALALFGWSSSALIGGSGIGAAWSIVVALVTAVVGARWCFFFVLCLVGYHRARAAAGGASGPLPPVSILVPAHNEGETIEAALRSLIRTDYPSLEIIVVDDGSTDQTFALAKPFEGEHGGCTVRVYRKPNGGKWSALNFAFSRSLHELVLCVDADSRLEPRAIGGLVAHMKDPQVGAVAGQVRVRNRVNTITRLQGLEYVMANGLIRMAQSATGTVLVVPGPIGLFRRSVLEEVYIRFGSGANYREPGEVEGPFEGDTFAEDFDLSVAILALGAKCVYEPAAVSHTKAPDWSFRLLNQRYRWGRGTLQVLRKYSRRSRVNPEFRRPRLLAWLGLTYALELVILPAVQACGVALLIGTVAAGGSVVPLLGWFGAFMFLNFNAAAFFLALHRDRLSSLAVLPLYDLYHGLLLNCGWVIALVDEFRGRRMRW